MGDQVFTEPGVDFDGLGDSSVVEPTVAAFSPNQQTSARSRNRASILIHQQSALVTATPPQVTRALAYSHPFILPLNYLVGLLTWSTGDPWESFLLVAGFWFTTLYGDIVLRLAGPVVFISALIMGIYSRRYSPLSRKNWLVAAEKPDGSSASPQQRKSLDEIIDTLQAFSSRCEVLADPFLRFTEFLTSQSTASNLTTRPALFSLFVRIAALTPIWFAFTLPPMKAITTNRVVLVFGTIVLTWHSLPARASRTILWRSHAIRALTSLLTGLDFAARSPEADTPAVLPPVLQQATNSAQQSMAMGAGVRFTFAIFENQRRWIGLGYSDAMLPSDRQPWTDEHLNACPEKSDFPLPDTDFSSMQWRWVPGSEWRVDRSWTDDYTTVKGKRDPEGWTYYDNRWDYAASANGWGKYTRRRRWIRDAELVETEQSEKTPTKQPSSLRDLSIDTQSVAGTDISSDNHHGSGVSTPVKKKGWFGKRRLTNEKISAFDKAEVASINGSVSTGATTRSRDGPEEDVHTPIRFRESHWDRSVGDGLVEGLS